MNQPLREALQRRRDRMAAMILAAKEDFIDPYADYGDSKAGERFRKIVLDQINDYYDFVAHWIDIIEDENVVVNQAFLTKLNEIYDRVNKD